MPLLRVNGETREVDASSDTPLLWVLRDHLGLTGTKFGCGIGACGSCTVHLDGVAVRACVVPLSAVVSAGVSRGEGGGVRTIEGLAAGSDRRLSEAWIAEQVPQCGYCQPGMLMAVAALLQRNPAPSDEQIDASITNLCRCGTQPRVRRAIHRAVRSGEHPAEGAT